MTEHELERWTTLVVAEARGQTLAPAAKAERRRIEREQPELIGEASLWAEFVELDRPRACERDDEELMAAVLAVAAEPKAKPRPDAPPRARREPEIVHVPAKPRWIAPVVVLAAVAACLALGLSLGLLSGRGQAIDRELVAPLGGAVMARDDREVMHVATPGEHRLADGDCRRAGSSAKLCTRERARFRVAASSTAERVELELDEGQLQVDASADSTWFEIRTPVGLIRTRGIVELDFDPARGELAIEVIAGEAEVIEDGATPVHLGMGVTLSLLARAEPELAIEPDADAQIVAPAEATPSRETSPSTPSKPSADELLTAAQQALAAGDSALAIERYQALIDEHPASGAARTASVSLGRLLLRAGRAKDALSAFDRYLASDAKELLEEARYGRIRALRELGRAGEVDEAIAEFLLAHPGSLHRERLEAWRTP